MSRASLSQQSGMPTQTPTKTPKSVAPTFLNIRRENGIVDAINYQIGDMEAAKRL